MHDRYLLQKDHLKSLLRKLMKEYRLVAPARNRHGDVLFVVLEDLDAAELDLAAQPQNSLKEFFFPQREALYAYEISDEGYRFRPLAPECPPTIYFGVHPCDLSAILYMDVVFSQGGRDNFYLRRRRESVLIGVNCGAPPSDKCFCNATGHGPFLDFGADLMLTDLGGRFFVEADRAQGQALVRSWRQFFEAAGEEDRNARYQSFLEARGSFQRQVHVEQAIRQLADGAVAEEVWAALSLRCHDCGGCAYLCPTCTCFTITDQQTSAQGGVRLRSWDACTFAGFTRMAGGHNPVAQRTGALRQRFLHKLRDDVARYGRPGCVGCGRCVGSCFGGADIVRFVEKAYEGGC